MTCIFGMQINIEVFCKLILSFWVCIARHAQSTQNKKVKNEVDFFLQINIKGFFKLLLSF